MHKDRTIFILCNSIFWKMSPSTRDALYGLASRGSSLIPRLIVVRSATRCLQFREFGEKGTFSRVHYAIASDTVSYSALILWKFENSF